MHSLARRYQVSLLEYYYDITKGCYSYVEKGTNNDRKGIHSIPWCCVAGVCVCGG